MEKRSSVWLMCITGFIRAYYGVNDSGRHSPWVYVEYAVNITVYSIVFATYAVLRLKNKDK